VLQPRTNCHVAVPGFRVPSVAFKTNPATTPQSVPAEYISVRGSCAPLGTAAKSSFHLARSNGSFTRPLRLVAGTSAVTMGLPSYL
jgi:hypothetical protein